MEKIANGHLLTSSTLSLSDNHACGRSVGCAPQRPPHSQLTTGDPIFLCILQEQTTRSVLERRQGSPDSAGEQNPSLHLQPRNKNVSDGDCGITTGSDGSGMHGSRMETPEAADIELDLTSPRVPLPQPKRPAFYREFGIDESLLPVAGGPARDPDIPATFETLMAAHHLKPIGVADLSIVHETATIPPGQRSTCCHVAGLLLMGHLSVAGEPVAIDGHFHVCLTVEDVTGNRASVFVREDEMQGLSAQDCAAHVALHFPEGTAVGFTGIDLVITPDSYRVLVQTSREDAAVFRVGEAALPPVHLFQVRRTTPRHTSFRAAVHLCGSALERDQTVWYACMSRPGRRFPLTPRCGVLNATRQMAFPAPVSVGCG